MKKLTKIKLTQLNKAEVSEKELNRLLGGSNCCTCGCAGPSGPVDNNNANYGGGSSGLASSGGGVQHGSFA
ncbi:TIGR04149 family rSAM-modified RiPP [Bacteroides sp.]